MTPSFTCPACGLTTPHETHVRMLHCVACHRFMRDWALHLKNSMDTQEEIKIRRWFYYASRTEVVELTTLLGTYKGSSLREVVDQAMEKERQ